jgi:ferredoxin--NADP+ reductase
VAPKRVSRNARLGVRAQAAATTLKKADVPLALEEGPMPLNTFGPKKPFKATIKSVERIVGPKATGETMHIVIETNGDIPFWEGQSYGVIPPVRTQLRSPHRSISASDCGHAALTAGHQD